jgi:hypothetical protein
MTAKVGMHDAAFASLLEVEPRGGGGSAPREKSVSDAGPLTSAEQPGEAASPIEYSLRNSLVRDGDRLLRAWARPDLGEALQAFSPLRSLVMAFEITASGGVYRLRAHPVPFRSAVVSSGPHLDAECLAFIEQYCITVMETGRPFQGQDVFSSLIEHYELRVTAVPAKRAFGADVLVAVDVLSGRPAPKGI